MVLYPATKEEWWDVLLIKHDALRNLVANFHPSFARWSNPMKISAHGAEAACDMIREKIEHETKLDPLQAFDKAVKEKDGKTLLSLLNATWFGLPESMETHQLDGFGALCNLCSESYCLGLDEEEEENY
jgi:hypothetical protein